MSGCARVGQLVSKQSALFLCDIQEKFRQGIQYFPAIVEVSHRVLRASKILNIKVMIDSHVYTMPVVVTEQYPKGTAPLHLVPHLPHGLNGQTSRCAANECNGITRGHPLAAKRHLMVSCETLSWMRWLIGGN
ncbi:unnamed protein product [Oppiella nova]|uniref:Isochorismatase-like domain-containing protein n=1 Tax=Oppiella nova TaxID=334625 RepID=A0A7R9QUG3_9ACAR|nr:unnamed protein product [Oppiella nova]CAG2175352.1 unnamed protein product [Oppiella nova]